jgi:hypothetical protein
VLKDILLGSFLNFAGVSARKELKCDWHISLLAGKEIVISDFIV